MSEENKNCWISDLNTKMSLTEYRCFLAIHAALIITFIVCLVLMLRNIRKILIKQSKWKIKPFLFFCIFAFICIVSRLIVSFQYGPNCTKKE